MKTALVSQQTSDLIIIGAGAAGLSLLLALDNINYPHSVTVLERNSGPLNDRIWSFWSTDTQNISLGLLNVPRYIASIISHRWSHWSLSTSQSNYAMRSDVYRYCCVRSDDLSRLAQKRIDQNPRFRIIYNSDVTLVRTQDNICTLTSNGLAINARKVLDTRPPPIDKNHTGLLQCFYGEEITLSEDFFEPSCVQLMHQLKSAALGIEFVYVLPFNTKQALIEFTCFSLHAISKDTLKLRLHGAIKELLKQRKYTVERSENAVLPMYLLNQNHHKKNENICYGGIAGGAMRASTGYSFLNSQGWATQCARELMRFNRFSPTAPIKRVYCVVDMIMLKVLRDNMSIGVSIFELMFKKVKPARFVRFMTQQATIVDFISVIWAMPKKPFLIAACKLLINKK
jgi:lycopene beta-cyclase